MSGLESLNSFVGLSVPMMSLVFWDFSPLEGGGGGGGGGGGPWAIVLTVSGIKKECTSIQVPKCLQ